MGRRTEAPAWKPRHFGVLLQRHRQHLHLRPSLEAPLRLQVSNLATRGQQKTPTSTEASTPPPNRDTRGGTGSSKNKKIKQRSSSQGNRGWKFPSAGPPSSPPSHLSPWFHTHGSYKSFPLALPPSPHRHHHGSRGLHRGRP